MPVVLIPVHFDRDVAYRHPSCQRSVVIRPFITEDFMTGVPALPGKHIPATVSRLIYCFCFITKFNCILLKINLLFLACTKNDGCCSRNIWYISSII